MPRTPKPPSPFFFLLYHGLFISPLNLGPLRLPPRGGYGRLPAVHPPHHLQVINSRVNGGNYWGRRKVAFGGYKWKRIRRADQRRVGVASIFKSNFSFHFHFVFQFQIYALASQSVSCFHICIRFNHIDSQIWNVLMLLFKLSKISGLRGLLCFLQSSCSVFKLP